MLVDMKHLRGIKLFCWPAVVGLALGQCALAREVDAVLKAGADKTAAAQQSLSLYYSISKHAVDTSDVLPEI